MPQDPMAMMPPESEAPAAPMSMSKMGQMLEELAMQYPELEKEAADLGAKLSAIQDEEPDEPSLDEEAPEPMMEEEEPSLP